MRDTRIKKELKGNALTLSYDLKDSSFGTLRNNTSNVLKISFKGEFSYLNSFSVLPKQSKCFSAMFCGSAYIEALKLGRFVADINNPIYPDFQDTFDNIFGSRKEDNNESN